MPEEISPRHLVRLSEQEQYLRDKYPLKSARWSDILREGHDHAFTVAGIMRDDYLADILGLLLKSFKRGDSLDAFKESFAEQYQKLGWHGHKSIRDILNPTEDQLRAYGDYRARIIYDTNIRTSYAAGRYAQLKAIAARRPCWRYRHSHASTEPRPQHLAWDGKIFFHGDEFWREHFPPNGWGCKCTVESLELDTAVEKYGFDPDTPAPPPRRYEWTNPSTGEIQLIPVGIDPGFNYTPGASVFGDLQGEKRNNLLRELAAARKLMEE